MIIRKLTPAHASDYRRLRLHGLKESPAAFGSSYEEEVTRPIIAFESRLERKRGKWTLAAFQETSMVGVLSFVRHDKRKERHKASIYGMYVKKSMRGMGIGRGLLEKTIEGARRLPRLRQINISVVESNRAALNLYESVGFTIYGREEAALFVGRKYYTELYLALRL